MSETPPDSGPGLRQRLRYRFDNLLARGTWATLLWLGIITMGLVIVSGILLALFGVGLSGSQDASFLEETWQSLLRALDTGTMAGDVGWGRRILALVITLFGVLVAGTVIGVIAAGVEDRIDRMRRGRSPIVESGHVVVLGASNHLAMLLRQLVLARQNLPNSVIVVMADRDPAEMQEEVRTAVADPKGSRFVFRSGDPTRRADLSLVRLARAERVIILAQGDEGDAAAIRTLIAVRAELEDTTAVPIVVELVDPASAARVGRVYPDDVHPIVPALAVARIATAELREPGAGRVAIALLDDRESDVHVAGSSDAGRTFAALNESFLDARPIGRMRPDGSTELNPSPGTVMEAGDRLVVVSRLPAGWRRAETAATEVVDAASRDEHLRSDPPRQHLLVVGWSRLGALMLRDWAERAAEMSTAEILVDTQMITPSEIVLPEGVAPTLVVTATDELPDLTDRLAMTPAIDTILLLGSSEKLGDEGADAMTLLNLVAIRRTLESVPGRIPRLMVELRDVENIELAGPGGRNDFVVSQAIGSQLISQLAEQPERRPVFLDLYDPATPSIHLVEARALALNGRVMARDLFRAGQAAGMTAIGWWLSAERGGDLVINPSPTAPVDLTGDDQVVVIA